MKDNRAAHLYNHCNYIVKPNQIALLNQIIEKIGDRTYYVDEESVTLATIINENMYSDGLTWEELLETILMPVGTELFFGTVLVTRIS